LVGKKGRGKAQAWISSLGGDEMRESLKERKTG